MTPSLHYGVKEGKYPGQIISTTETNERYRVSQIDHRDPTRAAKPDTQRLDGRSSI